MPFWTLLWYAQPHMPKLTLIRQYIYSDFELYPLLSPECWPKLWCFFSLSFSLILQFLLLFLVFMHFHHYFVFFMIPRVLKFIQTLWLVWPTWCALEEGCGWRFQRDHRYVCFTQKHWNTSKRSTFQHPLHIWALASATCDYGAGYNFGWIMFWHTGSERCQVSRFTKMFETDQELVVKFQK